MIGRMALAPARADGDPGRTRRRVRGLVVGVSIVLLLAVGWFARGLDDGRDGGSWLPWMRGADVTFYYLDDAGNLVPVSRTLEPDVEGAATVLATYLEGPDPATGLSMPLTAGTSISASDSGEDLVVEATGGPMPAELADPLQRSLASWWTSGEVVIGSVSGPASLDPLVYFVDAGGALVAERVVADDAPAVLDTYLAGPRTTGLTGLPPDVDLRGYRLDPSSGLLRLDLSYTESVRRLALDHPERMRRVLEGLITTMVQASPDISGVYLDFEGQSVLGLGQCADLLRNLQVEPEILNDERLLAGTS
jgi:hypothetical protein